MTKMKRSLLDRWAREVLVFLTFSLKLVMKVVARHVGKGRMLVTTMITMIMAVLTTMMKRSSLDRWAREVLV